MPLELCSLLRQPFFSLLGLLGCSLCCLIPALLLNFSASWVLVSSHLPKQPQRLYQDNYSFHQLFIKLVSFACRSQFSKAPSLWWLTFPRAVFEMFFFPAVPVRLLWRGWARHCASCTLLLGQAGATKSYCALIDLDLSSETSSALVNLLGRKTLEKLHAFVLKEAIELFTLGNREIYFAACWRSRWVVIRCIRPLKSCSGEQEITFENKQKKPQTKKKSTKHLKVPFRKC